MYLPLVNFGSFGEECKSPQTGIVPEAQVSALCSVELTQLLRELVFPCCFQCFCAAAWRVGWVVLVEALVVMVPRRG